MLDIILTIFAWRRGWRFWSLLPLGVLLLVTIILAGSGALDTDGGIFAWVLVALSYYGTLIYMVTKPRKRNKSIEIVPSFTPEVRSPNNPIEYVVREKSSGFYAAQSRSPLQPPTIVYRAATPKLLMPDHSEISLTKPVNFIGRDDFEKHISPENLSYISRNHFLIRQDNGKYFVEDLKSANGTKTAGQEIKGGMRELSNGDTIEVAGVAALTFRI